MTQLHKKFTDFQIKELLQRYLKREIESAYVRSLLGIGKTRFFALVHQYREAPHHFSIQYHREKATRAIAPAIEHNLRKELQLEKKLIQDKNLPLKSYNYSYIKDRLAQAYQQKVSLPTIIARAKKYHCYLPQSAKKIHDREVLTTYAGELIQHDSSHHQWSPYAPEKWFLISSLDDYSRFIFYAKFVKKETSWAHILALESIFLNHGLPYSFYVDSHSIFRFVQGRDSIWRNHRKVTDAVAPQWKQVLNDCGVKLIYARSPQAKGKIERPFGWLQDRIVRTAVRENVTDIAQAQQILNAEIKRYNYRQVHSTTQEVPYSRLQNALQAKKSLFRTFTVNPPFQSPKDIFCLRVQRTTDAYRKISIHHFVFKVNAPPYEPVDIRIYPLNNSLAELRCWCDQQLIDIRKAKITDLKLVHF